MRSVPDLLKQVKRGWLVIPWRAGVEAYTPRPMRAKGLICVVIGCGCLCGCVERSIDVTSNPPGALVTMNDQEVGRTPFSKTFTWYGTFEVQVRKEGYQTLKVDTPVIAPWWQWIGFDLLAEVAPIRLEDHHEVAYSLKPVNEVQVDPEAIVERGQALREKLESSQLPPPATRPTTKPAKVKRK